MYKVFKGFYFQSIAYIGVITQSRYLDLNSASPKHIIQLWHGTPLKKMGFDDKISNHGDYKLPLSKKILKEVFPVLKIDYNYSILISSSKEVKNKLMSCFGMDPNKIKITGYPRNDALFDSNKTNDLSLKGIYMPTFRDNKSNYSLFSDWGFDVQKVTESLKKNNVSLFVKLHPFTEKEDLINIENILRNFDNIHVFKEKDIYKHLNEFDFLITDYSSIYFDYLLLNRPIIFAPFDIEYYLNDEREMYYDYNEVTPGPKARNWLELMDFIEESIKNPQKHEKERLKINKIFNKYNDSKSSARVFEEIIKLIK